MNRAKFSPSELNALRNWWAELEVNKGDRAQLRRAQTPDDVLLTSGFSHFLRCFSDDRLTLVHLSDLALVAAVLAHVKEDVPDENTTFAKSLAASEKVGSEKAVMSELRFQKLQKSPTPKDFFRNMCRAVKMLKGKANVVLLAQDTMLWLTEYRFGPSSKPEHRLAVRWASDYYLNL